MGSSVMPRWRRITVWFQPATLVEFEFALAFA
jgi:hypothetical protein